MALLSDVREQIKSELIITGSIYDAQIETAICSALRQLRTRKFWFLEKLANLTLTISTNSLTLPTDFGCAGIFELINSGVRLSDKRGFDFISLEALRSLYWVNDPINTAQPVACAISNGTLYFSDIADKQYTIPAIYYQKDATLPTSGQTSIWFDDGYDVVCSLGKYIFKRDSQQYTATEEDGSMVELYLEALGRQHERYEGGR